jgi:AraC-like DNA-binding protein
MEKPAKLRGHLHYLIETGENPDAILAGTGVSFDAVESLTPMPTKLIAELFDIFAARTPDDFAVRCGRATRYQNMGILGYRLLNCGTVRELLETWNRYSIVIGYPLESRLIINGNQWSLEFRPRYSLTPRALRFCMETTIAGCLPSICAMSSHDIQPISYGFPFPAPDELSRYETLAPTPITFNREAGIFTGRRIDIDLRLIAVDLEAKAICDDYCRHALARITNCETTSERLRAVFAASPGRLPTAAEAAALLGLSLRTLQRQLLDEGLGYHRLVEDFRHEEACGLLDQGTETKTIAYLLGFQDVGSFRRAFRKWTGQPPSQWNRHSKDAQSIRDGTMHQSGAEA